MIHSHKNSSFFYYFLIVTPILFAGSPAFYWENQEKSDCLCQGLWVVQDLPQKANDPIITWEINKQIFRLKNNIVEGQDVSVWGKGMAINAPKASFQYAPIQSQRWDFSHGASVIIKGMALETQQLTYDQYDETLLAHSAEFFMKEQELWGQAGLLEMQNEHVRITDLKLSFCPPIQQSWNFYSDELSYDLKDDVLIINNPRLDFQGYSILSLPTMRFEGAIARHRLENLPRVSVATQAGMGISFPMLWVREKENIQVIPEINLKKGPGIGFNLQKNNVLTRGFLQLFPPSSQDERYWMVEMVSADQLDNFSYSYQGSLISHDDFVYKYPHLLVFDQRLYYTNRAWARHKLGDFGNVQFYGEKLYRSEEARQPGFEVIENTAQISWLAHKDLVSIQARADVFNRYDDRSYYRWFLKKNVYWHKNQQLSFKILQYPDESFGYGLSEMVAASPTADIGIGSVRFVLLGRGVADYGQSPLIDTTAQPLNFDSLSQLQWHQGEDWVSQGLQITPQLKLELSDDIEAHIHVSCALQSPSQPWVEPNQPYLTPFRNNHRFSPVGLKLKGRFWQAQALFDGSEWEWVTSQWERSFYLGAGATTIGVFYHRYFPLDRLSHQTDKVAQLLLNYDSGVAQPWRATLETRFNLIPVKLENAFLGLKYQHCCWNAGFKFGAQRQYNSDTAGMKWDYHLSFSIELTGSGLGSQEKESRAFPLMPQIGSPKTVPAFYQQMIY